MVVLNIYELINKQLVFQSSINFTVTIVKFNLKFYKKNKYIN